MSSDAHSRDRERDGEAAVLRAAQALRESCRAYASAAASLARLGEDDPVEERSRSLDTLSDLQEKIAAHREMVHRHMSRGRLSPSATATVRALMGEAQAALCAASDVCRQAAHGVGEKMSSLKREIAEVERGSRMLDTYKRALRLPAARKGPPTAQAARDARAKRARRGGASYVG